MALDTITLSSDFLLLDLDFRSIFFPLPSFLPIRFLGVCNYVVVVLYFWLGAARFCSVEHSVLHCILVEPRNSNESSSENNI